MSFDFLETAARRKLSLPEEWKAFHYEVIDPKGECGDILLELGVPRELKSGPRKGHLTWKDCGTTRKCVVTQAEADAEKAAYEVATGHCWRCEGIGQEWAGWSKSEGRRTRTCTRCEGTGSAPIKEATP